MSSSLAHRQNAGRNRERILDVASRLIGERGFAATTISAVCKEASVAPPTVYWHFGDKQRLAVAVMERAAHRWFEDFLPYEVIAPEGRPDPLESGAMESLFRDRPEFLRLLLMLSLERRDPEDVVCRATEAIRRRVYEVQSEVLERRLAEIEDPDQRRSAAKLLSKYCIAQIDGIFIASQLEATAETIDGMARLLKVSIQAAAQDLIEAARRPEPGYPDCPK